MTSLLTVAKIHERLSIIFPEGTEQRTYLVREMSAKTIFTALYARAVEGNDRWIRPNQVCRMTSAQSELTDDVSRDEWYVRSSKNGYVPLVGTPWFADTTREPIRDETIGEGLLPVRAMIERAGVPTTSSKGRYALEAEFARLFDPILTDEDLVIVADAWRLNHLSKTALARQALIYEGALVADDAVPVRFPNGEHRHLAPGASSVISKAVIEEFAPRFLKRPHVLWLSESGNKVVARDDRLARALGIEIDPSKSLPDIILVDLGDDAGGREMLVVFTEVVATDGPINRQRKAALMKMAKEAGFEEAHLAFLTAFMDRSATFFRKAIVEIAWGSFVWFAAEPDHLIDMHNGKPRKLSSLLRTS